MTEKSFITLAIGLENAAYDFYNQWSKIVDSPAATQVLLELRDIEKTHADKLLNLQSITESCELPPPDVLGYAEIEHKPLSNESKLDDILLVALRMEAKSYETYSRYAAKFKDDSYNRSFFIQLAEEEKRHIALVKTLISDSKIYIFKSLV